MQAMRKLIYALLCLSMISSGLIAGEFESIKRKSVMNKAKTEQNPIQSINYRYVSKGWSAFSSYFADGKTTGAHLSGNPPFVHEDKSTVSKTAVAELWQAAETSCKGSFPKDSKYSPQWAEYHQVDIIRQKGNIQFLWQEKPEKQDPGPEITKLLEVILKYHIGGW